MASRSETAFNRVKAYADAGYHQTGSRGNQQSLNWLEAEISQCSARLFRQVFSYPHFDASTQVLLDGNKLSSMALSYSATGTFVLKRPASGTINAHADQAEIDREIKLQIDRARNQQCDGLLLTTLNPVGDLCAINRHDFTNLNFPVILLPGHVESEYGYKNIAANCHATYTATIETRQTTNLIASFGQESDSPVIITTPMSGWFACAGERGSGIAIAIELAEQLGKQTSVELLLANGHELGFIGGHNLAQHYNKTPRCILHLGSCIANVNAEISAVCSFDDDRFDTITRSLDGWVNRVSSPVNSLQASEWMGESECWAQLGVPMISIAGASPLFHTPQDLPGRATSPQLLEIAIERLSRILPIMHQ